MREGVELRLRREHLLSSIPHIKKKTYRDRETDRERQTDRQTERYGQTNRQTDREISTHKLATQSYTYIPTHTIHGTRAHI